MKTQRYSYLIREPKGRARYDLVYGLGFLLLLGGVWVAMEAGKQADRELREDILHSVIHIASAISPEQARALTFTGEDSKNPTFLRLRSQLKAYAQATGLRSLYSMALRDGKIVFGPESLDPGDPSASPPGTVYENPAPEDFELFKTGNTNVQGPRTDEYGSFVSALAPVKDPRTGKVLMAVGIDVETPLWYARIIRARMFPLQILMLLLVILAASVLALRYRKRYTVRRYPVLVHIETVVCALLMLTATAVSAVLIHNAEKRAKSEAFTILAHAKITAHINAFDYLRNELNMLVSFFESSEHINRAEFRSYCGPLVESRIIQACGWTPAVRASEADNLVAEARADGLQEFTIWQNGTNGTPETATGRDLYYPTLYVEPQAAHKDILGYDLRSDSARWPAVENAILTGVPTATDPAILFAVTNRPHGFVIYQSASNALQQGVAILAILPSALMQGGNNQSKSEHFDVAVSLFHLPAGRPPEWLACSEGCTSSHIWKQLSAEPHQCVPLFTFNQTFALLAFPGPDWYAANPLRMGILASFAGLALTALLTTLIGSAAGRQAALEKAIEERSAELRESEKRFSSLFLHMSTGFALYEMINDAEGNPCDARILEINPAFEKLVGAKAENDIGKTLLELRPDLGMSLVKCFGRIATTGQPETFENKDSLLNRVFSSTAYRPAPGQCAMILEDVTEHRKIEEDMRRLLSIVTNSPAVAYLWQPGPGMEMKIEYVSGNVRLFGYEPEDFTDGKVRFRDVVHPDDAERIARETENFSRDPNCKRFGQIYRITTKYGLPRWVQDETRIVRDANGRITHYQGVMHDITRQKDAEAALRESEAQLSNALQLARAGNWMYDVASDTFTFNDNFYRIFRTTAEQAGGYQMASKDYAQRFCHPDDIPVVGKEIQASLETTDPNFTRYLEHRIIYADGEVGFIAVRFFVVKDEKGRTIRTYGINQDISEQKNVEQALKESEERYAAFINSTDDLVFIKDNAFRYVLVNAACASFFQRAPQDIIGLKDADLMPPGAAAKCRETDRQALESRRKVISEEQIGDRFYETCKFPVMLKGGLIGIGGLIRDITAMKLGHNALVNSEKRYRVLVESQPDAICRWLPDTTLTYVNESYCRFFGKTRDQLLSSKWIVQIPEAKRAEVMRAYEDLCRNPSEFTYEHESVAADGGIRWQQWIDSPILDEQGAVTEFQSVGRDITQRKQMELDLAKSRQQLEELLKERTTQLRISNEAKKIFLSTMSHELHTPLNAVMGFSEALQEGIYGKLQSGQVEPVEHIRESARRLHSLIDDLLNITRIEGGVMPFHAEPLPIRQVLEESVLLLQASARHRKQTLSADFQSIPDRLRIRADLVKIKQIMHHLISNAIKFTPKGGQIEAIGGLVDGHGFGLTGQCLRVAVRDNGQGLSPEEVTRVFDRFYQADSTLSREHGGTGLGLSIAREFVQLHGGRIWAESGGTGQGSVFTFIIPTEPYATTSGV